MIPYRDENETLRTPLVTFLLIGLNVASWILVQGYGTAPALPASVCNFGLIAGELTGNVPPGTSFEMGPGLVCATDPGPQALHLFTSMFLHGSWMHLIGNMWFLWIFGNNVEDVMGRIRFVLFYLIGGLAAAGLQIAITPSSPVPMVGASGAISAVMGAYLLLFPKVRVYAFVPLGFFLTSLALPAWTMLLYWMFLQTVSGVFNLWRSTGGGGVAFWAHIGGFLAGLILIKLFAKPDLLAEHRAHHWRPRRVGFER